MTYHNFKSSLAKGQQGELLLLNKLPFLVKLDGRRSDFVVGVDCALYGLDFTQGETLELKTDYYQMDKTNNFFIEIWSDIDRGAPGGPMQAFQHGSTYWLYMYALNSKAFLFKTEELCKYIEAQDKNRWPSALVPNKSWTTMGYKIPRQDLKHLYTEITFEK